MKAPRKLSPRAERLLSEIKLGNNRIFAADAQPPGWLELERAGIARRGVGDRALLVEREGKWARHWRAEGWMCAFIDGLVFLVRRGPRWGMQERQIDVGSARCTEIAGGSWLYAIDVDAAPWRPANAIQYAPRLRAIARDCYCTSFPDTGCDFCNGTRRPDGAIEGSF